ncbi:MAG: hypothetical protein LRZ88_02210 [Candidatus Cloacimonetes bacterium]|nr:hypothetical protein [Candidatus Cloacimonadota bacterium]
MKKIIHIDMDAYFAAIEIRENPSLKGKCVIVGAHPIAGGWFPPAPMKRVNMAFIAG